MGYHQVCSKSDRYNRPLDPLPLLTGYGGSSTYILLQSVPNPMGTNQRGNYLAHHIQNAQAHCVRMGPKSNRHALHGRTILRRHRAEQGVRYCLLREMRLARDRVPLR